MTAQMDSTSHELIKDSCYQLQVVDRGRIAKLYIRKQDDLLHSKTYSTRNEAEQAALAFLYEFPNSSLRCERES